MYVIFRIFRLRYIKLNFCLLLNDFIVFTLTLGTSAYMMNGTTDRFEGSRFIKSMCDVLCEYGEDEQLAHLLIRIKKAVNDKNGHVEYEQNVQSRDSLTKRCFFKPGK